MTEAAVKTNTWIIDPAHSGAHFSVRHLMVSKVRGQFSGIQGTVTWNESDPTASKVDASVDVSTINTNEANRDAHLRSPEFFDAAQFPTMHFVSKSAVVDGDGLKVTGDFTLHGVTKEVTLEVEGPTPPVKDMQGNERVGVSATTVIDRRDFGLVWNASLDAGGLAVGNDVTITLDLELTGAK